MTTKILLLGNTGQLGWELNRTLLPLGELVAMDYPKINMADAQNIRDVVRQHKPNLIINATAYTDVDRAESQTELALAINGRGPGILAEETQKLNAALIHYSTDYVFDGTKGEPYTEEDQPNPLSVYGETKLEGERTVVEVGGNYWIFRTSWVYSLRRPSFVTKVMEWARKHETLRVVDDQVSTPTWARTLAETTAQAIAQGRTDPVGFIKENCGLYHLTDGGFCSRYDWAKVILELDPNKEEQIVKEILPAKSRDFTTAAERPYKSRLNTSKFEHRFAVSLCGWLKSMGLATS